LKLQEQQLKREKQQALLLEAAKKKLEKTMVKKNKM
jgi:hypothetical protein